MKKILFGIIVTSFIVTVFSLLAWPYLYWEYHLKDSLIQLIERTNSMNVRITKYVPTNDNYDIITVKGLVIPMIRPLSKDALDRLVGDGITIYIDDCIADKPEVMKLQYSAEILPLIINEQMIQKASFHERKLLQSVVNVRFSLFKDVIDNALIIDSDRYISAITSHSDKVIQGTLFQKDMTKEQKYMILLSGVAPSVAWDIAKNIRFADAQNDAKLEEE